MEKSTHVVLMEKVSKGEYLIAEKSIHGWWYVDQSQFLNQYIYEMPSVLFFLLIL
jgi:hypothetical protein